MSVVGIDLGISKIAVVVVFDDILMSPYIYECSPGKPRDVVLHELGVFAHTAIVTHAATSIWIEDTLIGNNRKYSIKLSETKGAVMSYLSHLRTSQGVDIQLVNNQTWKREIVGSGNADKEAVRNHIYDTHPAYAALCGDDQDLYDASCVALYGRQVTERAQHLQL